MRLPLYDKIYGKWYPNYNKRQDYINTIRAQQSKNKTSSRSKTGAVLKLYDELTEELQTIVQKYIVTEESRGKGAYLYVRISGKRIYLGKDWSHVFEVILWDKAEKTVYGDDWKYKRLSPAENHMFDYISKGLEDLRHGLELSGGQKEEELVRYYAKQLGMTYRKYSYYKNKYYRRVKVTSIKKGITAIKLQNTLRSAIIVFKKYRLFTLKSGTKYETEQPLNTISITPEQRQILLLLYKKKKLRLD